MEFINEKFINLDSEVIEYLIKIINKVSQFKSVGIFVVVSKNNKILLSKAFGQEGNVFAKACKNKMRNGGGTECQDITVCCLGFGFPSQVGNYCFEYLLSLFIAFFDKEKNMKRILRKVAFSGTKKEKDFMKEVTERFFLWVDGKYDKRKNIPKEA